MSIKGYPSQEKESRTSSTCEFPTINPVSPLKYGMDVASHEYHELIGTDAAEADSTAYSIVATAHAARKGDTIRITSGTHNPREIVVVATSANLITLGETLSSAIAAAVTFQILRPKKPVVGSSGATSFGLTFTRNSLPQEVIEDTVTPTNTRALPVKIVDSNGREAAISVAGAVSVTLANDLNYGAVGAATLRTAAQIGNATGAFLAGAGAVSAQVVRTTPASDSPHLLATRHETETTPLSGRLSDGTNWLGALALAAAQLTFSTITKALQTISVMVGWDGTVHRELAVDTSGRIKTDISQGRSVVYKDTHDYSSVNVTSAAYVELIASTGAVINRLQIFDSSGQTLILATGAGAAEVDLLYIPPGGIDIDVQIAASTRLAIKAFSTTASAGVLVANGLS